MNQMLKRFLNYVEFDTTSDDKSDSFPTTSGQMELARYIKKEMEEMGLSDITLDNNGYLMGTLEGNTPGKTLGLIAHMDTSPDMSGKDPKPQVIENYPGGDIVLSEGILLKPADFPELNAYIGQDIVCTDGKTLLGADNKAGIAEIITAVNHLKNHPEILHGPIRICFTPDEEVGRGADRFDVEKFGADYAYTIDGGEIGELEFESFNAASARVTIQGSSVHPGRAKNKMMNAIKLGMEFQEQFPVQEAPEHTEGYEGFYHLNHMEGSVEEAVLYLIIRDFDRASFEKRKNFILETADKLNKKYGKNIFKVEMKDQYYNMGEVISNHMFLVDIAKTAMLRAGVEPLIQPIRGGTDGSRLSFMGLPTPNIFTGGHNYHGKYEFIPVQSMEKAVEVIINIAGEFIKIVK